jgi:thiol-disulfide isomerase/thioredoxin
MRRIIPFLPLLLLSFGALACGDETGIDDANAGGPREGYPRCYGTAEGAIIDNLEFVGSDNNPFSLADVYRDGHNRLLLINSSAGWCTACIEEQPALAALHDAYADDGLFVLVTLYENAEFAPANGNLAARWKSQYGLPFAVAADPDFILGAFYDRTLTPMNMLVDVDTMEIVKIITGYDARLVEAIIQASLL